MDDELGKAGSAKAGLNTGANGSAVGGNPAIPKGVEVLRVPKIREMNGDLEKMRPFGLECGQRGVDLTKNLPNLRGCVAGGVFGHFHPTCDAVVNHDVGPARMGANTFDGGWSVHE